MRNTLRLNAAWSVLMVAAFAYLAAGNYNHARGVLLLAALAYLAASVFALRGHRWAIGITVVVATLLMIRWLPMVLVNFWMFGTGHDLYRDSPATIFIVVVYAVVFAIPSVVLCTRMVLHRRDLWFMLSGHREGLHA